MGVLAWIVLGLVVGMVARLLMPGRAPVGLVTIALVGMVGVLIEGFQWAARGWQAPGEQVGFGVAVVGAMLLAIARASRHRPRPFPRP
jgi:uncharacterized membrane protein YeaQ/YmgE (transglycosylase-associated protein family)